MHLASEKHAKNLQNQTASSASTSAVPKVITIDVTDDSVNKRPLELLQPPAKKGKWANQKIDTFCTQKGREERRTELDDLLCRWLYKDTSQTFSTVDNEDFRKFIAKLDPIYEANMPNRRNMAEDRLDTTYRNLKVQLQNDFKN
ncbi:hypothetical protein Ciccas_003397, partial [Cichlidogyrus casuarinus]